MNQMFGNFTQVTEQALSRLKVRSAVDPCLWLCALCIPFGMFGALFSTGWVQIFCAVLALSPVALFAFSFIYLMLKSPDKLRSEEYELKKMALGLIEEKGSSIPVAESSVEAIANYDYKPQLKLPNGGTEA